MESCSSTRASAMRRVPFGVVGPGLARGPPAAADAFHGTVHGQDLEQQFQRRAAKVNPGFERHGGDRGAGLRQRGQDGSGLLLRRHGCGGEVLPDLAVLRAGQQQDVGVRRASPCTAHLLVVGHRGGRRAQVDHEAEVRLVEAHAQGGGGHERLDLVVLEELLGPFAVRGVRAARCRRSTSWPASASRRAVSSAAETVRV